MTCKIDKQRFQRRPREQCFRSGPVFDRFWAPARIPRWKLWVGFRPTFAFFWTTGGLHIHFLCSEVLGEGPGTDSGSPGSSRAGFRTDFGRCLHHSGRRWWSSFVSILPQVCRRKAARRELWRRSEAPKTLQNTMFVPIPHLLVGHMCNASEGMLHSYSTEATFCVALGHTTTKARRFKNPPKIDAKRIPPAP